MAGIDENIVREYFELGGFLVRQLQKYQVQSRKKRAEEEIDIVAENPLAREGDLSFIITDEDLPKIRRAAIAVRGWHTTTFSAATLNSSGQIFNFLQKSALKRLDSIFGEGHKICKILYFADREHLSKYGRSITGDVYIAMTYGPGGKSG